MGIIYILAVVVLSMFVLIGFMMLLPDAIRELQVLERAERIKAIRENK
jgi:hypothetical protein